MMDIVSMENHLNLDLEMISISGLSYQFTKHWQVRIRSKIANIDYEDYKGGYCFWGYDLTPDQAADQSHLHPIKTGNLRLELQFATSLDKTINVLVYAEFDNLIEINGLREVTTDY